MAVAQRSDLRGRPDPAIFAAAQAEGRAIVTENVSDFHPLAAEALQQGRSHAGLIFSSDRRFPRHDHRTTGRLVIALDALLSATPDLTDREYWLS